MPISTSQSNLLGQKHLLGIVRDMGFQGGKANMGFSLPVSGMALPGIAQGSFLRPVLL